MRFQELLEYKRDITITNFGDKFLQRMEGDETISDFITDGGLDSETGEPYEINDDIVKEFLDTKIEQIEQADPSPNKQYVQWMLLRYLDGSIELFEDILSTTAEMLGSFHNLKVRRQLPPHLSDINKFKGKGVLGDLHDEVTILWNAYQKKRGEETALAMPKGNANELYNDANVRVIIPNDKESACYYGQGTKWCTASTKGINYFDSYNKRGKLYIFIPKNPAYEGEKYQLHDDGSFLNEKDQRVQGGLKWLLYERFPIKELRDLWIKTFEVVTTTSVAVTSPSNGITNQMFGFGTSRTGTRPNYIFTPTKPQHKGEQYQVHNNYGKVTDENGKNMDENSLRWLIDERFPDRELKDALINPSEVLNTNELRVVRPKNTLTNVYYTGYSQRDASYVIEPKNPLQDGEEYSIQDNGTILQSMKEIRGGMRWLIDERFPSSPELKDLLLGIEVKFKNSNAEIVRPSNSFAKMYLLGDGNAFVNSGAFDIIIPTDPKFEGEVIRIGDWGSVSHMSYSFSSPEKELSMQWLFNNRFPGDNELKDFYIKIDKNVFENDEVRVDMANNEEYFAKKYIYPNEHPPEGDLFIINPKHPSEDNETYTVVIGENKIYNKHGHAVTDFRGLFTERFKDPSLLEFFNGKFSDMHEMKMSDTVDFTPTNVLDEILTSMKDYAFEHAWEIIDDAMVNDDYYYDWLRDEGYVDDDGDWSDDAPSYTDYSDDARRFTDEVNAITDITMDDINDQKDEMREEDGIFHLSELPEIVGAILKDNTHDFEVFMGDIEGHLEDLILHDTKDKNGNITNIQLFTMYEDDDGKQQRRMRLEKSYEI